MMYLHLLSLVTLVPEAPCFVFDVTRRQITVGVITWLLLALWFDITHTNKYTHNTNRDNRPTHKYILTAPVMCSQQLSLLHWINRSLILKIYFYYIFIIYFVISLLFKNQSLAEVAYLLIKFSKTKSFLWNTKNTDRNHVNEQKTRTRPHTIHLEKNNIRND